MSENNIVLTSRKELQEFMNILENVSLFKFHESDIKFENLTKSLKGLMCITLSMFYDDFLQKNNKNEDVISFDKIDDNIIDIMNEHIMSIFYEILNFVVEEKGYVLNKTLFIQNFEEKIKTGMTTRLNEAVNNRPEKDIFPSVINYVIYETGDNAGKIEEELMIISEKIEKDPFTKGMAIGVYTLEKELSKTVWKARKNNKYYAIRLIPYDVYFGKTSDETDSKFSKRIDKFIGKNKESELKKFSLQHINRMTTQSIKDSLLELTEIMYYSPEKVICEVVPFCEKTLENLEGVNKHVLVFSLIAFLKNIHKSNRVFNNLCPDKIGYTFQADRYVFKLFDLSCMSKVFKVPEKLQNTGYESKNILKHGYCSYYDDLESLSYIINYILIEHKINFENELDDKKSLTKYTDVVANSIRAIRNLEQNDLICNDPTNEITDSYTLEDYTTNIYKFSSQGLDNYVYSVDGDCILQIFYSLGDTIRDVSMDRIYGTKLQEELYKLTFNEMCLNSRDNPEEISRLALEKTMEILYGVTYYRVESDLR